MKKRITNTHTLKEANAQMAKSGLSSMKQEIYMDLGRLATCKSSKMKKTYNK